MTFDEVLAKVPQLNDYLINMPKELKNKFVVKIHPLLYLVSQKVALKLYRSSSNRGAKLFYPPTFLLLDYLIQYAQRAEIKKGETLILKQTREELYEEVSISVKTLNRTISKLKQDEVISIIKGKIAISYDQYKLAKKMVKYYVKQDVKNS